MTVHEDNELRRQLWRLADNWDATAEGKCCGPVTAEVSTALGLCAGRLREILTYPVATDEDEARVQRIFGKSSDELADEAEEGYPIVRHPDGSVQTLREWVDGAKDASTLPQRMREAADTLVEATERYRPGGTDAPDPELHDWRPANLRYVADQFEEEDMEPVHPDTVILANVRELITKWDPLKNGSDLQAWAYKTFWTELRRVVGEGGMSN